MLKYFETQKKILHTSEDKDSSFCIGLSMSLFFIVKIFISDSFEGDTPMMVTGY